MLIDSNIIYEKYRFVNSFLVLNSYYTPINDLHLLKSMTFDWALYGRSMRLYMIPAPFTLAVTTMKKAPG
jgi:hypothetical protein